MVGDHPRLRGEKCFIRIASRISKGSPPLTRGKGHSVRPRYSPPRITPAYAGKRRKAGARTWRTGDHPRLRGEKPKPMPAPSARTGSPPLTRGKGRAVDRRACEHGITPAYAGKRWARHKFEKYIRDHPRLRGEKQEDVRAGQKQKGSPPLTRGKVKNSRYFACDRRITPAYAGKRGDQEKTSTRSRDHPRLRGEKGTRTTATGQGRGSPPLTRGKV